jgi:hypothetical protein
MPTPPNITMLLKRLYLPYTRTLSSTCAASSRVGVRISARIGMRPRASRTAGLAISRCSIGSVKPAVLPVPVCAPPIRSAPDRMVGMACAWIGVGVS